MSLASAEVRAMAEAALRAINSGDVDAFVAVTAADVEFTSMVAEAEGTTFRGHDGVRAWWETVRGAFQDVRWELLDVHGSGDRAVVRVRMAGTLGGVPVEQTMWQAVEQREGKLTWWASFRSEREALETAGLREATVPQDDADVVRRQFEAIERGAFDAAARFWHPDIEWRAVEGAADDVGVMTGHDALRRYYEDWIDTMDELHADVEEVLLEANEQIVVVVRNSGRGRASGVLTAGRYFVACKVRHGQIVSGREYETREQALEAVGLSK